MNKTVYKLLSAAISLLSGVTRGCDLQAGVEAHRGRGPGPGGHRRGGTRGMGRP
jgi:hypothetical protein